MRQLAGLAQAAQHKTLRDSASPAQAPGAITGPTRVVATGNQTVATRHLVTLKEAVAVRPWLTERYGRRLIGERRIPFHKIGAKVLLDLADLDAFAEAGRVEAARR
jgi:excisionase family DNA binding protein